MTHFDSTVPCKEMFQQLTPAAKEAYREKGNLAIIISLFVTDESFLLFSVFVIKNFDMHGN